MNFLELINKCLLELNYKTINSLAELTKNDHKRIVNILNIINKEICGAEKWNFLLHRTLVNLPANKTEIYNNVKGRILYMLTTDGKRYDYNDDIESFLTENPKPYTFSSIEKKLLFPKHKQYTSFYVVYLTDLCVLEENGVNKEEFQYATDKTLIPMPFAEPILVYGTCLRLKGSPQHFKFSYWMSMYKDALLNLKSRNHISLNETPSIKLYRD